jgi:hypothetical protein
MKIHGFWVKNPSEIDVMTTVSMQLSALFFRVSLKNLVTFFSDYYAADIGRKILRNVDKRMEI